MVVFCAVVRSETRVWPAVPNNVAVDAPVEKINLELSADPKSGDSYGASGLSKFEEKFTPTPR